MVVDAQGCKIFGAGYIGGVEVVYSVRFLSGSSNMLRIIIRYQTLSDDELIRVDALRKGIVILPTTVDVDVAGGNLFPFRPTVLLLTEVVSLVAVVVVTVVVVFVVVVDGSCGVYIADCGAPDDGSFHVTSKVATGSTAVRLTVTDEV